MKLSIFMDGISRDPVYAFQVMNETGISYANIQYAWDKEIGQHSAQEMKQLKVLADQRQIGIAAVSPHTFSGVRFLEMELSSSEYQKQIEYFKRTIESAHLLGTRNIRIHSCQKQIITWGENGADKWLAKGNIAWDKLMEFMRLPVCIAEEENVILTVETAAGGMISSGYLAKKFVEDLGSANVKVCWDAPNTLIWHDIPYPNAYNMIKDVLGEVHIKDAVTDAVRSTMSFCQIGEGDMAPYLTKIAAALRGDGYGGFVVLECTWRPTGGTFEDGYRINVPIFKKLFA